MLRNTAHVIFYTYMYKRNPVDQLMFVFMLYTLHRPENNRFYNSV